MVGSPKHGPFAVGRRELGPLEHEQPASMAQTQPILIAFGFTDLSMLAWLAAAAAPIVIHLWSRRRFRETTWAAMEYLLAAVQQKRRRLRFEQWLLLLLRTLIVVLIVLAVAEPYLVEGRFHVLPGVRTHRVLVIDGSYSMGYTPEEQSRFALAQQTAAQIVEASAQGDGFTLILMAEPPQVVVGLPALEPAQFVQEIDRLNRLDTSADLPATIESIGKVLKAARREYPRLVREEIYFLTDLGRQGWQPEFNGRQAAARFQESVSRLAEVAGLVIIDVGQQTAENLAVTQIGSDASFAVVGRELPIEVAVKNFGRQDQGRQLVELLLDGRRAGQKQVELPAGQSATVRFSVRFDSPGDHAIEARLAPDRLDVDNHRWLVAPVKRHLRVLCVDGRPSGHELDGATGYLVTALAPHAGAMASAHVRTEVVPESALMELELRQYDVAFLVDVAQLTASETRALANYLEQGGSLVFFLGPRVLPARYNRQLIDARPNAPPLLPFRLDAVVENPSGQLDPLGYEHPIVQVFRGRHRAGLLTTPVQKYVRLEPLRGSQAKVALATASGDPLIVEHPVGRGRVVLVATSADTSWTAMPLWPSYVPIVQEILRFAVGGQFDRQNRRVGRPLEGTVPPVAADEPLELFTPGGRSESIRPGLGPEESTWRFRDTWRSGIYSIGFEDPAAQTLRFAVNLDTKESDLTPLSETTLRQEVFPGVPLRYQTDWEVNRQSATRQIGRRDTLSPELLWLVFGALLIETFIAWRFGYHT